MGFVRGMAYTLLTAGLLSIVPALAVLFLVYGRYEGQFRDEQVFLLFIGGLAVGLLAGLFQAFAAASGAAALIVFGLPALEQLTKGALVNWRKFRGTLHAVFLGGSAGLGVGTMLAMRRAFGFLDAPGPDGVPWLQLAITCPALVLFHFATGMTLGDGVRRESVLVPLLRASAYGVPVAWALYEYDRGRAWIWLLVVALWSAALAVYHTSRTLPLGASEEWRRARRRRLRADA